MKQVLWKTSKLQPTSFENISGDKTYNLAVIDRLSGEAAEKGARAVAFHECSVTGYTFARHLSKEQLMTLLSLYPMVLALSN